MYKCSKCLMYDCFCFVLLTIQAREGGIDLQLVIAPDSLSVLQHSVLNGDRSKLALVLRNLLSNALKFTKTALVREVRVTVECYASPSYFTDVPEPRQTMLSIRVTDSGAGMSQVSCFIYRYCNAHTDEWY